MVKARAFFFVSAGLLCLALAYHLGATSATAQAPGNPVVAAMPLACGSIDGAVITSNGDVYVTAGGNCYANWSLRSNVFSGPTPAQQSTWGNVKVKYRN